MGSDVPEVPNTRIAGSLVGEAAKLVFQRLSVRTPSALRGRSSAGYRPA